MMHLGPCPRNKYQLKLFKFYLSSLIPRQGFSKPAGKVEELLAHECHLQYGKTDDGQKWKSSIAYII
jgi:hypothetical protein